MCRVFLIAAALLLCMHLTAGAQEVDAEREKEAVKRAVETYLYAEDVEEKKRVSYPEAKIISVDSNGNRIRVTSISKPAGKMPRGAKMARSPQKIVSIDVAGDGASVKVVTEWESAGSPTLALPRHHQYISLLKLNGEWKIVSILMPTPAMPNPAGK